MTHPATCILLSPKSRQRQETERRLSTVYRAAYGARLPQLPPTLAAWETLDGVAAAAGLRWRPEGFFLQHYLSRPLTETLPAFGHGGAPRLVEVCHLAAWQKNAAAPFVRAIVELCLGAGADWALFTATAPLRRLLRGLEIPFVTIAPATADRVEDAARWGRYYDCDPWVCAVGRDALEPDLSVPGLIVSGLAAPGLSLGGVAA